MNAALDILIVIIFATVVIVNWRKGFFKSVMGFASLVIAFIVTNIYYKRLADYFADKYLYAALQKSLVGDWGSILAAKTADFDLGKLLNDQPSEFLGILHSYNVSPDQVSDMLNGYKQSAVDATNTLANEFVAKQIANPVAYGISCFLAFILIFTGCMIVLKIATVIVDKIFKLPGLNFINKLLGLILGVVMAVISCFIFAMVANFALPYIQSTDIASGSTREEIVDDTLIFKHFYDFNPFSNMNIEFLYSESGILTPTHSNNE